MTRTYDTSGLRIVRDDLAAVKIDETREMVWSGPGAETAAREWVEEKRDGW